MKTILMLNIKSSSMQYIKHNLERERNESEKLTKKKLVLAENEDETLQVSK